MRYYRGDSVMIHSGKYTSFIGEFIEVEEGGRIAKVKVDLSPVPIVRTLRILVDNISHYSE